MPAPSEAVFTFPKGKNAHIMIADGCIKDEYCDLLVAECNKYFLDIFNPGITMGGFNPMIKNSMDFGFDVNSVKSIGVDTSNFAFLEERFREAMYMAVHKYIQVYEELWKAPGIDDTGFRLQRYYRNAGFYRTHCDALPWDSDGTNRSHRRVLGVIIYLNDVEVGGETEFPKHKYKAEARKGRITIFPTSWTHPHSGNTPLSSDKWMISSFITCRPVPDYLQPMNATIEEQSDESNYEEPSTSAGTMVANTEAEIDEQP
jgi:hypothetical protein